MADTTGGQRRAQLMAEHGQEMILGVAGVFGPALGAFERLLGGAPIGHVPRGAGHGLHFAIGAEDRDKDVFIDASAVGAPKRALRL